VHGPDQTATRPDAVRKAVCDFFLASTPPRHESPQWLAVVRFFPSSAWLFVQDRYRWHTVKLLRALGTEAALAWWEAYPLVASPQNHNVGDDDNGHTLGYGDVGNVSTLPQNLFSHFYATWKTKSRPTKTPPERRSV